MTAARVKKVKPYPIPIQMMSGPTAIHGQIIKLVLKGFMVDTLGKVIKVGAVLQVSFELPVTHNVITQNVKVMKTYDRTNLQNHSIDRIAECHFTAISDDQQTDIYTFLQLIRQDDMT